MAVFTHTPLENASPARRRVLEHVQRLLDGNDLDLVGTVSVNLMIDVIMAEVPDGDLAQIDAMVDELAAALRKGVRNCLACARRGLS
jgi:hypothetical protein